MDMLMCHARLQVNRLELTLSIGSFAAALGAMIAGIFGELILSITYVLTATRASIAWLKCFGVSFCAACKHERYWQYMSLSSRDMTYLYAHAHRRHELAINL